MKTIWIGIIVALGITACGSTKAEPTTDVNAINTSAVKTVFAQVTAKARNAQATGAAARATTVEETMQWARATILYSLLATQTPPAPAVSGIAKIGDRLEQEGYVMTVLTVEKAQQYGYLSADPGKIYLAVEILFESTADSGVDINTLYSSIKDSDGYQYTETFGGKDPSIPLQKDMPNGEKVRGWITYEIPAAAHGFVFTFQPVLSDIRFRVDLGQ